MKVIITNLDELDDSLPEELSSIDGFEFGAEVNIPVSLYNQIFNISFLNDAGMKQNKYNIVVISMEASQIEIIQKKQSEELSKADDYLAELIISKLDLYDGIFTGIMNMYTHENTSSATSASIAIFNSIVNETQILGYSEPGEA